MELFLCFEVQVDIGEKKAFWRREGRVSNVVFGESDNERKFYFNSLRGWLR